jgi:hypothetical protein
VDLHCFVNSFGDDGWQVRFNQTARELRLRKGQMAIALIRTTEVTIILPDWIRLDSIDINGSIRSN